MIASQPGEQWHGPICDEVAEQDVLQSVERFSGRVWTVRSDTVSIGGDTVTRDYVVHTGAVAVIALDASDRIYLLRQYRHPVGMALFEPPAGLLDVADEAPLETAKRELAEEAGLIAYRWDVLVDFYNSPGGSSEGLRVYLAREVRQRDGGRILTGEAEERHLPGAWVGLDDAVRLVLAGRLANPTSVIGILAAAQARATGWSALRPGDSIWPMRDHLIQTKRVRTDVNGQT